MTSMEVRVPEALPVPAADTEALALMRMIQQAASDPNVDIIKLERLFEMREKIEDRRAQQAYNTAMSKAQAELIPVAKNANNKQTHSRYADLSAIAEAALPIIHNHGFGLSFSECPPTLPDCMGIACEVMHEGGAAKRYEYNIPLDGAGMKGNTNKTATHAYGSTFTYGRRYATLGVFNITVKEMDNDGNGRSRQAPEYISEQQVAELTALITETKTDITKFLEIGNVASLSDILVSDFAKARGLLLERRAKMAEKAKVAGGVQ